MKETTERDFTTEDTEKKPRECTEKKTEKKIKKISVYSMVKDFLAENSLCALCG